MIGTIPHISFTKRDIPIPADYRPLYKIGHEVLILAMCCRSNKASLMKMHFLCWAIKSKKNMIVVQEWIKADFKSDFHIWGIEPTVNRALKFASADNIINETNGDFILTDKGKKLYNLIKVDNELFHFEKIFLTSLGKNTITEQKVKELTNKFF